MQHAIQTPILVYDAPILEAATKTVRAIRSFILSFLVLLSFDAENWSESQQSEKDDAYSLPSATTAIKESALRDILIEHK